MSFRIVSISLILSLKLLFFPNIADSQNKKTPLLEVGGKVRLDEGELNGTTVQVYNTDSNKLEQQMDITETGKFDLQLSFQHNYELVFKNRESYPKKLIMSTVIPEKVLKRDPYFPPIKIIVTLFNVVPEIDPSFSENAVGKMFYSAKVDNFDSESYFNDVQIRQKIDKEVATTYQKKLEVAKTYEKEGNLTEAMAEYRQAADLKQGDDSLMAKIESLEEQVKQEEQAEAKPHTEVIDTLEKSLVVNPDSGNEVAKISQPASDSDLRTSGENVVKEEHLLAKEDHSDFDTTLNQTMQTQTKAEPISDIQTITEKNEKQQESTIAETTQQYRPDETSAGIQNRNKEPTANQQDSSVKADHKTLNVMDKTGTEPDSDNNIVMFASGLGLFVLLILLFLRKIAKQKDVSED